MSREGKEMDRLLKWMAMPTVVRVSPLKNREKMLSGLGGLIGIFVTLFVSRAVLGEQAAVWIVASMGASAVLLYAVPHSPFSSPWAVLGGHGVSAVIGVVCALAIPAPVPATAVAVGAAIFAMYHLQCIHPPGGATALFAVMGGKAVHAMGFGYVMAPVMLNAVLMLAIAVVFNRLARAGQEEHVRELEEQAHVPEKCLVRHSDLVYALSEMQSFIDVSEEDLLHIYRLAVQHAHPAPVPAGKA